MSEHEAIALAGFWKRAAARAIDTLTMIGLAALTSVVGVVAMVAVLTLALALLGAELGWAAIGAVGWTTIVFACLVAAVRYEVVSTARRGETLGKRCVGIRVIAWNHRTAVPNNQPCLPGRASFERWAIPHGAGVLVALVVGVATFPPIGWFGVLVGAGVGLAAWTVVYLSALLDKNGRGWHDKAAGTIVVEAPCPPQKPAPQDPQPRQSAAPGLARPVPEDS